MKAITVKKAVIILTLAAVVLFATLTMLLTATINSTVARDSVSENIPQLVREVAELESEYLSMRGEVTLATAPNVDLIKNESVAYVSRQRTVSYAADINR